MGTILENIGREKMSESFYVTTIEDEEMARKFAKFQLNKIQGLSKDIDPDFFDKKIDMLIENLQEFESIKSENIIQSLKNYTVINAVTLIEDASKRILKMLINSEVFKIKNLFERDEIHIKLDSFEDLKTSNISKGDIVASNFNLQNLNELNYVFSRICRLDFFETFIKLLELPAKTKHDEVEDIFEQREALLTNWDALMTLTNLRNKIVHNATEDVQMEIIELKNMLETTSFFILHLGFFVVLLLEIKKHDTYGKEMREFLELNFGDEFNVLKNIVSNQTNNFPYKKFR